MPFPPQNPVVMEGKFQATVSPLSSKRNPSLVLLFRQKICISRTMCVYIYIYIHTPILRLPISEVLDDSSLFFPQPPIFVNEARTENLAASGLSLPYTLCSYFCMDFQAPDIHGQNAGDRKVSSMAESWRTCFVLQVIQPSQKPGAMSLLQTSISQSSLPTPPHAYTDGPNPGLVSSCAICAQMGRQNVLEFSPSIRFFLPRICSPL